MQKRSSRVILISACTTYPTCCVDKKEKNLIKCDNMKFSFHFEFKVSKCKVNICVFCWNSHRFTPTIWKRENLMMKKIYRHVKTTKFSIYVAFNGKHVKYNVNICACWHFYRSNGAISRSTILFVHHSFVPRCNMHFQTFANI